MRSITSGVSIGTTSRAFRLSSNCSVLEAPKIAVLTLGFFNTQAIDKRFKLTPRSSATFLSAFTFSCFHLFSSPTIFSLSHSIPGRSRRVPSGVLSIYFPLKRPDDKGDQMVVPRPISLYNLLYSTSNLSRCNKLYCGCSIVGGVKLYWRATL